MPRTSDPSDEPSPRDGDRIAKLLARAGIASRREVERMIAEGRVALDGVTVATPATVLRSLAGITVDGHAVAAPAPARLFVYHKPPGLLVTERDPGGRPTIYDRLPPGLPRVVPVGRLDLATEGLLLLTTDGGLKRALELPANGVERTYRARAYGQVSQTQLEDLIEGVEVEGIRYGSIDANLERRTGANVWIELTLTEGKNREVRRVLEHLGLQVGRLIRTRYGPFVLGDLQLGQVGEVRQHDLVAFRQTIGGRKASATLPERVAVGALVTGAAPPPASETRTVSAPARETARRQRPGAPPQATAHPSRRQPGGQVQRAAEGNPSRTTRGAASIDRARSTKGTRRDGPLSASRPGATSASGSRRGTASEPTRGGGEGRPTRARVRSDASARERGRDDKRPSEPRPDRDRPAHPTSSGPARPPRGGSRPGGKPPRRPR